MAQVKLARGVNDALIDAERPTGADGKILIATDRYKVYTDIVNPNTSELERIELNQGLTIQTAIKFNQDQEQLQLSLEGTVLNSLDISQDNFIIMVQGEADEYYEQGVYCSSIIAPNTLVFKRTNFFDALSSNVSIFIYDGAKQRNFKITQENNIEDEETILYPSGWKQNENNTYSYSVSNAELDENSLIIFGIKDNDVSDGAYLINGATTDGALIINSYMKPTKNIELYVQQLPEGSESRNYTLNFSAGAIDNNMYFQQYLIGLEELSNFSVIISCVENQKSFQDIVYEIKPDIGAIDFWSPSIPDEPIELQIVLIPNESLNDIEVTLQSSNWIYNIENSKYYTNDIILETELVCGGPDKDYSSAPIVTCIENEEEYPMIIKIDIQDDRKTIQCSANNLPSRDIKINFTDFLA